jgi:hypothetical protein
MYQLVLLPNLAQAAFKRVMDLVAAQMPADFPVRMVFLLPCAAIHCYVAAVEICGKGRTLLS